MLRSLTLVSLILALCVISLGAYTRIKDAGLGCPDWPGCFGQWTAPTGHAQVQQAQRDFPEVEVHQEKAWIEMVHRYAASSLGLCMLIMLWISWRSASYRSLRGWLVFGVGLILGQGLLGMLTVTLGLQPIIVVAHLLGGFSTFALLLWLWLKQGTLRATPRLVSPTLCLVALGLVVAQVSLGGWTSANYAAPYCPDFPRCQGQWWPSWQSGAFTLWQTGSADFSGGVLSAAERVTIHVTHRLGALLLTLVMAILALQLWLARQHLSALSLVILTFIQGGLGIANALLHTPVILAVAHNTGALLLLSCAVIITYNNHSPGGHYARQRSSYAHA